MQKYLHINIETEYYEGTKLIFFKNAVNILNSSNCAKIFIQHGKETHTKSK